MTAAQFIHRRVLLPAFESGLKRRKVMRYWNQLERSQWLGRAALEEQQFRALQRLVAHAHETCPYYARAWARLGLHPGRLSAPDEFALWPIIDRSTIREHRMDMRSTRVEGPLISKATGGSSGVPLQFDLDQGSNDRRTAAWHRGYAWAGAPPGTRQLHLWGVPLGERPLRAQAKDALYHALYRRQFISCFEMGEGFAARFAAAVDRNRPQAIVAYANPLYETARQLERAGLSPSFRPGAIVVGAEKLHAFQRTVIERVFRAPVFETYGSREFMLIGAECEHHEGLHLTAEHLLVEVLDDDGRPTPPGSEGNVVITDLYNFGMPFVRYANGDRAIAGFGSCACGRGLPLLKEIVGRRLDMLLATGGRLIPGEFFPHLVKDFPAVQRFQITQAEAGRIRFALAAPRMADPDRTRLEAMVRDALGPGVRVDFESVADIPLSPAGKLQVVLNTIPDIGRAA